MKSFVLLFISILLAVSVQAQSRTLTVEEAILLAKERAPERLRTEALEQQALGIRRYGSTFFAARPEFELEYSTEAPFGERDYQLSLGLLQEIPIWSIGTTRRKLADAVERAATVSRDMLDRQITLRTKLLYNRAWVLSRQLELSNKLIASSTRLADASNKRLAAGDMSTLDRNTVVLETNRQRIEHEQVHATYEQAIGELEALTALDLKNVSLAMDTSTVGDLTDTISIYQLAPEYARLEGEILIAQAQIELARAEVRQNPTLGLHYAQDLLTIDGDQIEYRSGAQPTIEGITAPGRELGLSLSFQIPITVPGIWGPNELEVIERESELRMLEAERAALQLELAGRVARIRPIFSRVRRALEYYQESTALIEQNHELLERGYTGGELSVTELLVGRQQLFELQTQQLELIQDMREAELELQSITGR